MGAERILTYNFPQNRLSGHRINLSLYSRDRSDGLVDVDVTDRAKGSYDCLLKRIELHS